MTGELSFRVGIDAGGTVVEGALSFAGCAEGVLGISGVLCKLTAAFSFR